MYRLSCIWIELFVLMLFSIWFFFLSSSSSFSQSRPKYFDLFDLHCVDNDKILRIHVCAEQFSSQHAIDWIHSLTHSFSEALIHPDLIDSVFVYLTHLPLAIQHSGYKTIKPFSAMLCNMVVDCRLYIPFDWHLTKFIVSFKL